MVTFTQALLIIVITILSFIITAVGIQFFLLIKDLRTTISRTNSILDQTETLINKLSHPAASMNNLLTGLKEGVTVIETIAAFFTKRKQQSPSPHTYDEL